MATGLRGMAGCPFHRGFNLVGTPVGDFLLDDANANTKIMLLGKLKENEYNGHISAQFFLEDIAI